MSATRLDGKALALRLRSDIQNKITQAIQEGRRPPGLAVVLVGNDPASTIYVRHKQRACAEVGIRSDLLALPSSITEDKLLGLIHKLNQDPATDGILVQLPLPNGTPISRILDLIDPNKDVDGFHPYNLGLLAQGRPRFRACTPYGIMCLLETLSLPLAGLQAVVVGASNIVGKPMLLELLHAGCTVTICHSETRDLQHYIRQAELLVSAIGKPGVIQSDWIKPEAIVIDVGINKRPNGTLTGDLDFNRAAQRASAITPVPGGVGPMTVAILLQNTLLSWQIRLGIH